MPKYYLSRPDGTFSDFSDYPEKPADRLDGQWITGTPNGLIVYAQKTLADRLDEVFAQSSDDVKAQFYGLKAAIKLALESGDIIPAKKMIEITTVPTELQPIKDQMLALFQS